MLNQGKIVRCSWEKFQSISHDPDILYVIKDKGQIWMGDKCIAYTPKDIWSLGIVDTEVGKTAKITEVDEDGKPTKWEAVEFPEQVQSDYEQSDETAADYIKNRPFYSNRTEALNLSLEDFTFHDDGTGMGYYTYECSEPIHVDFNLDNIDYYISGTTHSGEAFACNKTDNASMDEEYSQFSDGTDYYSLYMYINSNNNLSIALYGRDGMRFQGALTFILSIVVLKQIPVKYIPILQGPSENNKLPISAFYAENLIEGKASELIGTASSELRRELMDYVLDERPCYAEYTRTDVIALQTKNFSYISNENVYYGTCADEDYLDDTACKVLWDDVIYDVVSSHDNWGYPCYGDKNLVEYPFYFVLDVNEAYGEVNGYDIYTNSTAASHTFRVYTETLSKVKQLDIACIPDEVKSLGLTGASAGDMLRVKTIDASGKPTEWETVSTTELAEAAASIVDTSLLNIIGEVS